MFRRRRRAKKNEASTHNSMEGDMSPRTRARWSQNVLCTLKSPRAITRFCHFLEEEYPNQLHTVEFWKQCDILLHASNFSAAQQQAKQLAQDVEVGNLRVNLDEGLLHRIYSATSMSALKGALQEAQQAICNGDPDLQNAFAGFTNELSQNHI